MIGRVLTAISIFSLWIFFAWGISSSFIPGATNTASPTSDGHDGVIGTDDRKLVSEFTLDGVIDLAALRASLAATQRLSCGHGGSASLVHRDDVIIFSAHQLRNDDGKPFDLDHCVFEVRRKEGKVFKVDRYPLLLATLEHGALATAGPSDDAWNHDNQEDWAVVRLARPVTGIKPYRLPERTEINAPGDAVTTVSDMTDNWSGAEVEGERLAQNCHVVIAELTLATRFPAVMHLDCDVGGGASGGAILQNLASGTPSYIGTTIAYTGNHCSEAGLATCFSIGRRLDADLVARVKGTTALRLTPEDEALGAAQDARIAAGRSAAASRAMEAVSAFPAQDDPAGLRAAELYVEIKNLAADSDAERTNALFLEISRLFRDPSHSRPEWPWLLMEQGESMLRQHHQSDAFQYFSSAHAVAPEALRPYLLLRMAQTTTDVKVRKKALRDAYLAGGVELFRAVKSDAELAEIAVDDTSTSEE